MKRRLLSVVLILQQLATGTPAAGDVILQAGKPLDTGALRSPGASPTDSVTPGLFRGEALYRVPILTPPGTGGLTPQVSLRYGSSGPNGALGVGWSIDLGFPESVSRSTRDGAPEYEAFDAFELGGQRLRVIINNDTPDPNVFQRVYVPEVYDHSRIDHLSSAAGSYWIVLAPDGTRRYYGYEPAVNDSVLASVQVASTEPTRGVCGGDDLDCTLLEEIVPAGVPFAWYLDRIEDRNGNVIHLEWDSLGDPGMRYLVQISYSDHVAGSVSQVPSFGGPDDGTLGRTRTLTFGYETRQDALPTYRTGAPRIVGHRLASVSARVDGAAVRHYILRYEQSPASGRSRLIQVEERASAGNPNGAYLWDFEYGDGGTPGWTSSADPAWQVPVSLLSGGRDAGVRFIDLNGDGYPDVVRAKAGQTRQVYLGGPTGFGGVSSWTVPDDFVDAAGSFTGLVVADLDGDRRPDLLRRQLSDNGRNHADLLPAACAAGSTHRELENSTVPTLSQSAWRNDGSGWVDVSAAHAHPGQTYQPFRSQASEQGTFFYSCPTENLATAVQFPVEGSVDTATRVVDANGDGLDDLIFHRGGYSAHLRIPPFQSGVYVDGLVERRHGALLNSAQGLKFGTLNHFHLGVWDLAHPNGVSTLGAATFVKLYDGPRWQYPLPSGVSVVFSDYRVCEADPADGSPAPLFLVRGRTGAERIADVNVDGLPDILFAVDDSFYANPQATEPELTQTRLAFMNNGYGWQPAATPGPEAASVPQLPFDLYVEPEVGWDFVVHPGFPPLFLPSVASECIVETPGSGSDPGWRVVDVNGDGGPDLVGGPSNTTRLWKATAPGGSLWATASGWNTPVSFAPGSSVDTASRLADVNGDGLIDILVQAGAYLNRSESPDRLETITNPYGGRTTLEYAATRVVSTGPPPMDPDQRVMPGEIWALSRITVDPGFGQPAMVQDLTYQHPVYDGEDRSFRGFGRVDVVGPTASYPNGGTVQPRVRTFFHVADELAGLPARVQTFDALGGANPLQTRWFEYASASGSDTGATVTAGDYSMTALAPSDPQVAAFTAFSLIVSGATASGEETFLRFQTVSEHRSFEGQSTSRNRRTKQVFDIYGNPIEIRNLGDASTGVTVDDVTTTIEYAILDNNAALLANTPFRIVTSGSSGPPGTTLSRTTEIYYDGQALGAVRRGNPTRIQRGWFPTEGVGVDRWFDGYGNVTLVSSRSEVGGPFSGTFTAIDYDPASRTFPTLLRRAAGTPLELPTTLAYELAGCGGPGGLGLPCSVTDPNGQATTFTYDAFGREIRRQAPNGYLHATDYHDADRGTANQRQETRVRWLAGGPDPATDPNAIVAETYTDGLGRTLTETRSSWGPGVAERSFEYDSAGRAATVSEWSFTGALEFTSFEYDPLGRTVRETRPDATERTASYGRWSVTLEDFLPGEGRVRKRVEQRDGHGRLALVEEYADPSGTPALTDYTYDPFGNLAQVDDAMANNPSLCPSINPSCPTQRHTTRIFYDELGNRERLDDPDTGTWDWEFDARGRVTVQHDPRVTSGQRIQLELGYDELDRLTLRRVLHPLGSEPDQEFTYGLADSASIGGVGRLIRIDDAEGYEEFEYDPAGNVDFHRRTIGGKRFDFVHAYDPLGRRRQTTHPDGEVVTWHHDKRHLVRISTGGGAGVYEGGDYLAQAEYEAHGLPTSIRMGGSAAAAAVSEAREYDAQGRLAYVAAVAGGAVVANLDYGAFSQGAIDGLGRVRGVRTNTLGPDGTALEDRSFGFEYDGLDRLVQASGDFAEDPAVSVTHPFGYDAIGNPIAQVSATPNRRYDDPLRPHALTHAKLPSGSFTVIGAFDAAGNATTWSGRTIAYDAKGNLTSITAGTAANSYGYDAGGRMLRASTSKGTLYFPEPGYVWQSGAAIVNKHFFVGGRRVASAARAFAPPSASSLPTPFGDWTRSVAAPPPWALAAAYAAAMLALLGLALRRRPAPAYSTAMRVLAVAVVAVSAPLLLAGRRRTSIPLGMQGVGDRALFYVTDHLGSTILTLEHEVAAGTVPIRTRYVHGPFGGTIKAQGTTVHSRFAGERLDPTGLCPLGVRFYDPGYARFVQPDPIVPGSANPQALNRYSYVLNSPTNLTDPTGLSYECQYDGDVPYNCSPSPGGGISNGASPFDRAQIPDDPFRRQFLWLLQAIEAGQFGPQQTGGRTISQAEHEAGLARAAIAQAANVSLQQESPIIAAGFRGGLFATGSFKRGGVHFVFDLDFTSQRLDLVNGTATLTQGVALALEVGHFELGGGVFRSVDLDLESGRAIFSRDFNLVPASGISASRGIGPGGEGSAGLGEMEISGGFLAGFFFEGNLFEAGRRLLDDQ